MNVINKLTQWASLIGVIGAIGGGFYAWGEFNTRLSAIENKDFIVNETVDLTGVNDKIANVNDKIANIRVETIDRIKAIEEKLENESETDISAIQNDISELKDSVTQAMKDIEIQAKINELQDSKIEQVRLKATNPLAN
jgi:septal ring factor EnvC (AmiA/AmiB activator)